MPLSPSLSPLVPRGEREKISGGCFKMRPPASGGFVLLSARVWPRHGVPERRLVSRRKNSQNHDVPTWPKSLHQIVATARDFFPRQPWRGLGPLSQERPARQG